MKKKTKYWIAAGLIGTAVALSALDARLVVRRYTIATDKLRGLVRVALITDLHSCRYGEGQSQLLSALEAAGELDQVSSIDLTHSTWVGMRYRENFDARLPLGEDMAHSLAVLSAAVEDTLQTRGPQAAGTMDLTQEMADAIFTPAES